ncbi:MAG: ZIP family metal transporter [Nitrososphaeraceae archaeon]
MPRLLGENKNTTGGNHPTKKTPLILAFVPIVVLAVMIIFLLSPYGQSLINTGIPLPQVTIEKVEFHENQILASIRNTGPLEIIVSQADVNDRIQSAAIEPSSMIPRLAEAKVMIPFPWIPGTPYEIGITTSDGTRFSKSVEAAALAPSPDANQALLFTSLGVYVGVIPVMIGLMWYPYIRRISIGKYSFFLSLTAGLLVFLGIDALLEVNEIVNQNLAAVFNGQALSVLVTISSFVVLLYASERLTQRAIEKAVLNKNNHSLASSSSAEELGKSEKSSTERQGGEIYNKSAKTSSSTQEVQIQLQRYQQLLKPLTISMMIAIGIGLHNFGEGLAIGAAMLLGEVALSTFLIVGFTLHNTTEGLAIVAPIAKIERSRRMMIRRLVMMGLIAGVPTIAGTWIGGFLYSPIAAVIFLSVGAGAIFQVVYSLVSWISHHQKSGPSSSLSGHVIGGFITGLLIMYLTGLLV